MLVECALSLILDRDRVQSAAAMEGKPRSMHRDSMALMGQVAC